VTPVGIDDIAPVPSEVGVVATAGPGFPLGGNVGVDLELTFSGLDADEDVVELLPGCSFSSLSLLPLVSGAESVDGRDPFCYKSKHNEI